MRKLVVVAAITLLIVAVHYLLAGSTEVVGWQIGMLTGAGICALATRALGRNRKAGGGLLLLYLVVVACLTILEGTGLSTFFEPWQMGRVVLFLENPNLLGSSLVVSIVGVCILYESRVIRTIACLLTGLALIILGAFGSLLAFASLLVLVVVGSIEKKLVIRWSLLGLMAVAGTVGVLMLTVRKPRNLLISSNTFDHPSWSIASSTSLDIIGSASSGPMVGSRATRLVGRTSGENRTILWSDAGRSELGSAYIASIYLKATSRQIIRLRSHLAVAECDVSLSWKRCVTPRAFGDGVRHVQLRLETAVPGDNFDFQMWGAQLEVGFEVSALETQNPITQLMSRYHSYVMQPKIIDDGRRTAMRASWDMFLSRPIVGWGHESFGAVARAEGERERLRSHAHNLFLHILSEQGVLGLLALALPFGALAGRIVKYDMFPGIMLLVPLAVLNMVDVTYIHRGTFFPTWILLGCLYWNSPALLSD